MLKPTTDTPTDRRALRVAFDVAPLHGHRTGVGVAVEHLLDALEEEPGVEPLPYLLSFRARPQPPQRRLPLPAGLATRVWARLDHPRVDRWLPEADVIHGTNYVAPPSRRPTVISVYDCWFLTHLDEVHPDVRRAASILHRAVARGAHLHVSSHATASIARQVFDTDRIWVIHLGPPAAPDLPDTATDDAEVSATSILFIGTLERRKDVPSLIDAFARLAPDHPDLQLRIAGRDGDDSERVAASVDRLTDSARARVELLGPVTESTKRELLGTATVLAYPSRDEGFGFPILEAQRAEVPVVARPSGSIPEIGGAGVELAVDDTIDALADALDRVIRDPSRRSELIQAGRDNLTRFSWSHTAAAMSALYRRAMADGREDPRPDPAR